MRDPARIDVFLEELGRVWKAKPDLRFGQLISNANLFAQGGPLFYVEDDVLLEGLVAIAGLLDKPVDPL